MSKRTSILLVSLTLAGAALVALLYTVSWKSEIEKRLKSALAAQGIHADFTLASVGWDSVTVKDVSFGEKLPFTIDELGVDYTLKELLSRQLRRLQASHIKVAAENISVDMRDVTVPFSQSAEKNRWLGEWSVGEAVVTGAALPLPPLQGSGSWRADKRQLAMKGEFKSADAAHRAEFALDYFFDDTSGSQLTLAEASLPWHGGTVSTRDAVIRLDNKRISSVMLNVRRVSLDTLLKLVTKDRASATGAVSGVVPIAIGPERKVALKAGGRLAAEGPGTLSLKPDAMPGSNPQLDLARRILADFRYTELTMDVQSGADEKLSLLLHVLGSNPQVEGGRPVKLNVHLTGDVLDFLQQSVLPMADPEKFLKQRSHEQ